MFSSGVDFVTSAQKGKFYLARACDPVITDDSGSGDNAFAFDDGTYPYLVLAADTDIEKNNLSGNIGLSVAVLQDGGSDYFFIADKQGNVKLSGHSLEEVDWAGVSDVLFVGSGFTLSLANENMPMTHKVYSESEVVATEVLVYSPVCDLAVIVADLPSSTWQLPAPFYPAVFYTYDGSIVSLRRKSDGAFITMGKDDGALWENTPTDEQLPYFALGYVYDLSDEDFTAVLGMVESGENKRIVDVGVNSVMWVYHGRDDYAADSLTPHIMRRATFLIAAPFGIVRDEKYYLFRDGNGAGLWFNFYGVVDGVPRSTGVRFLRGCLNSPIGDMVPLVWAGSGWSLDERRSAMEDWLGWFAPFGLDDLQFGGFIPAVGNYTDPGYAERAENGLPFVADFYASYPEAYLEF